MLKAHLQLTIQKKKRERRTKTKNRGHIIKIKSNNPLDSLWLRLTGYSQRETPIAEDYIKSKKERNKQKENKKKFIYQTLFYHIVLKYL